MKHLIAIVACIFLTSLLYAQDYKVNLSDSISIHAPVQMNDTTVNNLKIKMGKKTNVLVSFTGMLLDYSNFGLTADMLESLAPTEGFKEQFKTGFLNSMPGAVMVSDTMAKYQGKYYYYDFVINTVESNVQITMYVRSLFYKSKGINLYYALPKAFTPDMSEKDKFFNSVTFIE